MSRCGWKRQSACGWIRSPAEGVKVGTWFEMSIWLSANGDCCCQSLVRLFVPVLLVSLSIFVYVGIGHWCKLVLRCIFHMVSLYVFRNGSLNLGSLDLWILNLWIFESWIFFCQYMVLLRQRLFAVGWRVQSGSVRLGRVISRKWVVLYLTFNVLTFYRVDFLLIRLLYRRLLLRGLFAIWLFLVDFLPCWLFIHLTFMLSTFIVLTFYFLTICVLTFYPFDFFPIYFYLFDFLRHDFLSVSWNWFEEECEECWQDVTISWGRRYNQSPPPPISPPSKLT